MGLPERDPLDQLNLPAGFRFYPTDEELMVEYLCRKIAGHQFDLPIIGEIDLYKFDPWVLPSKALFGEKEWYFFSPRDRKYPNGSRPNRVAGSGYWKATGTDKIITTEGRTVGIKKALVFYIGKAPKGTKTNWIMHEYRLSQSTPSKPGSSKLDDWVLCRIYKKSSNAAKSTESATSNGGSPSTTSSSLLDDVLLGSIPEMDLGFPRTSSHSQRQGIQSVGSGNPEWSGFNAGLSAGPAVGAIGLDQAHLQSQIMSGYMRGACLPPLCHVESPQEKLGQRCMEEEVQSGLRPQRVNPLGEFFGQSQSLMLGQSYPDAVDPFGGRYSAPMAGFGFGQRMAGDVNTCSLRGPLG